MPHCIKAVYMDSSQERTNKESRENLPPPYATKYVCVIKFSFPVEIPIKKIKKELNSFLEKTFIFHTTVTTKQAIRFATL